MKPIILVTAFIVCAGLYSCSNDSPVTPGGSTSFDGNWTVDQVEMVNAPSGSSLSAMMKQGLEAFGPVSGSFVGYMNVTFGVEYSESVQTNLFPVPYYFVGRMMSFKGNTGIELRQGGGGIRISLDGGISWNSPSSSVSNIRAFYQVDENTAYVLGGTFSTGSLYKTTNNGVSWDTVSQATGIPISSVPLSERAMCFTSNTGYIILSSLIFKSTDGGATWGQLQSFSSQTPIYVNFFSASEGYVITRNASTYAYHFRRTTDGGQTWSEYGFNTNLTYLDHCFINGSKGWILFNDYSNIEVTARLYGTNDGGMTWNLISSDISASRICFTTETEGYISDGDFILKTVDGGNTWNVEGTDDIKGVTNIELSSEGIKAFTTDGYLIKLPGNYETSQWTARGKITNSVIAGITDAPDKEIYTNGEYTTSDSTILFIIHNYGGFEGNQKVGSGTYSFENGFLNIFLDLPRSEKWAIRLRRN